MKPTFQTKLVNDVFGDPGLLLEFFFEKRALLFDLGDITALSNATLLKVTHVFVSHTHIDHFIGFDRLLRIVFGRGKTLTLYGPCNFIANVAGKLQGFTWNLVDRYSQAITIEVVEVREDHLLRARFRAVDKFKKTDEKKEPFTSGGVLLEEPGFTVNAAILEHRVPCLGFALNEKFHVNINKDRLQAQGFSAGAWLNELKHSIHQDLPEDGLIEVPVNLDGEKSVRQIPLGKLKEDLVHISRGQKISYVVDTVFNDTNNKRIIELVRDADVFFCESPFIAEEVERARDRCHLTSRQAGTLARQAGVKELTTFHFSPKHTLRKKQLYLEAKAAFRGEALEDGGIT